MTVKRLIIGIACVIGIAVLITLIFTSEDTDESIILIKYATHPALDDVERGFMVKMEERGKSNLVTLMNSHGNPATAKQLAEAATNRDPKCIVTLATPASQAVSKTSSTIPQYFAAVSDPVGANLDMTRAKGIRNVSREIIEKAVDNILLFDDSIKRIGTIYNPAEQNSIFVQGLIQEVVKDRNLELISRTTSDPKQLGVLLETMAGEIDILYCANDNNVNKGVGSLSRVCLELDIPFVIGELSAVDKGALIGVGVEYQSMGRQLAELVLSSEFDGVEQVSIDQVPESYVWINPTIAKQMEVEFSNDFLQRVSLDR
jgi:putative ABC transport system substrate-binding protein